MTVRDLRVDLRHGLRAVRARAHGRYNYSSHVFVLHASRAVYLAVPKVANSSIKTALLPLIAREAESEEDAERLGRRLYHDRRDELFTRGIRILKHEVRRFPEYFAFTFVRNPFDRLVSFYMDKISGTARRADGSSMDRANRRLYEKTAFERGMAFDRFVREVAATPDRRANRHFRSQHTFVCDRRGVVLAGFVGRFERLNEDFATAMARLGAPEVELPHVRRTERSNYRDYYTPQLREIVAERYRRDLELFGYEF